MRCLIRLRGRAPFVAELHDILPAGLVPDPHAVARYYSPEGGMRLGSIFYATSVTRLVFRKNDGGYLVIPDTPASAGTWEIIRGNENDRS